MTIDEAIGILEEDGAVAKLHKQTGRVQALILGIEALERIKWTRECPQQSPYEPLPSEGEANEEK
jgi:hypothetical protein